MYGVVVSRQSPPPAEIVVDVPLVRALLREQHPDLAELSLAATGEGWDNCLFRLGDRLLVRLPRRQASALLVEHEIRWLPAIAPTLPLAIPVPERTGQPGSGYPWSWLITHWNPGVPATERLDALAADSPELVARFLAALHRPAPPEAPVNPFRQSLPDRSDRFTAHLGALAGDAVAHLPEFSTRDAGDALAIARIVFNDALAARSWSAAPVWLHGDLHPGNLIVDDHGRPSAVIDFGDLTSGDPAVDLATAWMLWPQAERAGFIDAYETASGYGSAPLWQRARGWAAALAVAYLAHSAGAPAMEHLARRTLVHLQTDPAVSAGR